jgi:Tfp pilus assembly protein PilO
MFRIKPSKKLLACLVGVAVLLLAISGLIYKNRAAKLHELEAKIQEKQAKLSDSTKIASQLTAVEAKYLDAQAKLSILEQGVSTKAYVPTLLRQIEDLGKRVGLRVVGVRPKPQTVTPPSLDSSANGSEEKEKKTKKPEPYDKLDIDLELHGKYWNVVRFLEEITYFPKIITVNDVQIAPEGQALETSEPNLTIKLNITAFILKDKIVDKQSNQMHACAQMKGTAGGEAL